MMWYWQADKQKGAAVRYRRWRPAIAALLLAAATGCAGGAPPEQVASVHIAAAAATPNPARGPAITNNALIGADGARLPLRRWLPRGAVKAVILALHGFNDYSNAFAMPAALWAKSGIVGPAARRSPPTR
jgi:acylglycerol lipase